MKLNLFARLPDVCDCPLYTSSFDFEETLSETESSESFSDIVEGYPSNPPSRNMVNLPRAKHWCFTLNNYTPDDLLRLDSLGEKIEYLVIGKEIGENGTPHLQGFVSFPERLRRTQCVETIGQAHFTVARNVANSVKYCKKDGDFVEYGVLQSGSGRRSDLVLFKEAVLGGTLSLKQLREDFSETMAKYPRFCVEYVNDHLPERPLEAYPLMPWQQLLYSDLTKPPDSRTITFVVDFKGNMGKSWFCHYYRSLHDNAQVILPGKKADMTYVLDTSIRVLFIDAPRSKQGEFIQYDFLEDVKNGYVFSTKYESRAKTLSAVHVVVMMNERPDETKLSRDRYDIRQIS